MHILKLVTGEVQARDQAALATFGLSFAQLELFVIVDAGTRDSARKSLGQLVWRKVHVGVGRLRCGMVRSCCSLGLQMVRECSRQV